MERSARTEEIAERTSVDAVPSDIAALVAPIDTHETGFFGPDSVMWRVGRENALTMCGVSAILLQLAHPQVAAGVADHSDFDERPLGRFRRTFELVGKLVFGDVETAVEAACTIRATHARVTGVLEEEIGPFAAGDRYAASRPDLLLWVHATLIDQALIAYETYVAPLPKADKAQYYEECKLLGQLLGIPEETYPETLADFYDYYERMLDEEIAVEHRGESLQQTLFEQGRVCGPLYAFLGASTLPDSVREAFGLAWSPRRRRAFDRFAAFVRTILPFLPSRLRYDAAYRRARARLGQ